MPTYTNDSPSAAQQLDSLLSQTRHAAIKQGRPWTAEASVDPATGEHRLSVVVGPQPSPVVAEATTEDAAKPTKPRKGKQVKPAQDAPPPVAEASTDVEAA